MNAGESGEALRTRIVTAARGWLRTPYRHQWSLKGEGCDCLGLVRGVWREVIGPEPEEAPPYRPDWAETGGDETLLLAARRRLVERPLDAARAGDVILFRMAPASPAKHCAIVSAAGSAGDPARVIHAYWGRAVVESWMGPWWSRRSSHAFAFPTPSGD